MSSSALMRNNMMLGQLLTNDITDKRILDVMTDLPREPFLPEKLRGAAYVDDNMDVGGGRFLLAPLTFARLLDFAEIKPSCRVLNIGCGTGYSAAVISKLAGHVVAIDVDDAAIQQGKDHMKRLGISNINFQTVKNMADGYAQSAPYNVIIIQGAINFISEALGSQLAVGGRLMAVRNIASRADGKGGLGKGLLVTRLDHKLQFREHFDASCPLLPGFEQTTGFTF